MSKLEIEMNVRDFVKSLAKEKGMKLQEVAKKSGKTQNNLSNILIYNRINLVTLSSIMEAMGEEVVLCLGDGRKIKIKVDESIKRS